MFSVDMLPSVRGKAAWLQWAKVCVHDQTLMKEVMHQLLYGNMDHARPAAEIVRHTFELNKSICTPYLDAFAIRLTQDVHPAIARAILTCTQQMYIPEGVSSLWIDLCMPLINHPDKPIATRVLAMSTVYNMVKDIPELLDELKNEIRQNMPFEGAAYRSRGGKILNKTSK